MLRIFKCILTICISYLEKCCLSLCCCNESTVNWVLKPRAYPVVMYGHESWTIKKAECQRVDAFELWCWRRLLRVPWTARRSIHPKGDQSWIFMGRTDAEAETPILWPPDVKNWLTGKKPWCWESLKVGGEGDDRGWDGWMASLTQWTWVWESSGSWWWTGKAGTLQCMGLQRVRHTEWLNLTKCLNSKLTFHSFGGWGNLRSWLGSWWRPSCRFADGRLSQVARR